MRLQGENARLREAERHLTEDAERARSSTESLKEQLRAQREKHGEEVQELRRSAEQEKQKHSLERSDLQEQLNKVREPDAKQGRHERGGGGAHSV